MTSSTNRPAPRDTGWREMPPVRTADERTVLLAQLEWYREGVLRKVDGMRQEDAVAVRGSSATSAAGIVKHLAAVEDAWFTKNLAREPMHDPWASAPWDDDPDWEFTSAVHEPLEQAVQLYREACDRSRAVVESRSLDDVGTDRRGNAVSVRWVLVHMLEETARHLGHLDVLRELADGTVGG